MTDPRCFHRGFSVLFGSFRSYAEKKSDLRYGYETEKKIPDCIVYGVCPVSLQRNTGTCGACGGSPFGNSGKIIYEKDASQRRSPASITKIMTLLLTFEALEKGKAKLTDEVPVSEYASSMGGSQVYLAEGEIQTLETMIKCIAVSSGNDASVAVAEYLAGSEQAFVDERQSGGAWNGGYPF